MAGFDLMNAIKFEIATGGTPELPTYSTIAKGINQVDQSGNEELDQQKYLDGNGYGETDVIGAQLTYSFSGHRFVGDESQDFIFGKRLDLGTARRVQFRTTETDGGIFEGECTIANINAGSGSAGSKQDISFDIHFNGLPDYTPPAP